MAFTYKLEHQDGTPADPPILRTAVSAWHPGDTIPLGRNRMLHVTEVRPAKKPDGDPVLVVEPAQEGLAKKTGRATSRQCPVIRLKQVTRLGCSLTATG